MLGVVAATDTITWLSISVKALVYLTALLAAGSILSLLFLRGLPTAELQSLKRRAILCALATAVLSVARLPVRAGFLMGGTWQGATDPMILTVVAESPLGTSIALRLFGVGLIVMIVLPGRAGRGLGALGACVVAASFVFRGHTLQEPRLLLGALIALHILGLAFWVGAFAPLYRLAASATARATGEVAHDFGRKAFWVVLVLSGVGAMTLWMIAGNLSDALRTPYGQFFAIKLILFMTLMGLAAWNKLRLTSDLLNARPGASANLRTSIRIEAAVVGAILLTTATMTTVTAPIRISTASTFDPPDQRAFHFNVISIGRAS